MNFIVVRNPQFILLPQRLRVALGEEYMMVETRPEFTSDITQARVFPSYQWADSYVHDREGKRRAYAVDCKIRRTRREHTIPLGPDTEAGV